jgi:hypothetical protein
MLTRIWKFDFQEFGERGVHGPHSSGVQHVQGAHNLCGSYIVILCYALHAYILMTDVTSRFVV